MPADEPPLTMVLVRSSAATGSWCSCRSWTTRSIAPRRGCASTRETAPTPTKFIAGHSGGDRNRHSHRSGCSTSLNRRPEPHGHRSLRPSFSISSFSPPCTDWSPRFTRASLREPPAPFRRALKSSGERLDPCCGPYSLLVKESRNLAMMWERDPPSPTLANRKGARHE
jgi:hypothetical protein